MKNKIFRLIMCPILLALCVSAQAQQAGKIYRLGRLSGALSSSTFGLDALRRELRELGYVEGKNISFELRSAEEKPERLSALADELIRLKVDLIIAGGPNDGLTAKKATKTIPVVFTDSPSDPVANGLVNSLARPGGNVTGFYSMADVLAGKRLQLLKESILKLSRVAVLWYGKSGSSEPQWIESQLAARQLGLQLHSMEIGNTDTYESAFKDAIKAGSAALAVTSAPVNNSNQKKIAELAAKHRLPGISPWGEFVASGGLMSYGADDAERYRRAAYLIDRILKGAKPADLPVEQPMGFEFTINLKTAKTLGLTIPPIVLMRATKVIK